MGELYRPDISSPENGPTQPEFPACTRAKVVTNSLGKDVIEVEFDTIVFGFDPKVIDYTPLYILKNGGSVPIRESLKDEALERLALFAYREHASKIANEYAMKQLHATLKRLPGAERRQR